MGGGGFPDGPVTILFSDVEGSTDLRTERGDRVAHQILRTHEQIVRDCVAAHGGREVKALGDGFMVVFSSPRKALECAVAIQQELEERNVESPGEELRVRIGVNTGEVVVEGDDIYGQAVNAAARIAGRAKGGEILVSEIVRQLAGSGPDFVFADRGRLRLKGFPERWHLYRVVYETRRPAASAALFAPRTPFVGREAERAELRRLVTQVKTGSGALVMVGGEPGVGKTRLSEELMARCAREGFVTFVGHCYEMAGAQPYIPIVEAYEQALAAAPSPKDFRQFLGDEAPEIARLVPKLRQQCPDIPPPLELPAEQERRYLFNAVWEVLARTARAQPTLLVLDDIHWADEPTMLLIQHCAERLRDVPVLMVGLYRDSELDVGRPLSRTFEELTRRRLAHRMSLARLPAETVTEMLQALAGQEPPGRLAQVLYAETEGNPFFVEEVFKHLAEEGRLFDADGRFRTDLAVEDVDVPEGVRLVVGARLRRLGEDGPRVLGAAAVLGRVFAFELLHRVEQVPEDRLLDLVEDAERARLISAVDDDRYIFAHELIRQTVLAELSAPRRRRLHARAAEALEVVHASALELHAAAIANHLIEAGPAADRKRTFQYLVMAGRWALQAAAFEEALAHLTQAAERIDAATPTERADLLSQLGAAQRSGGQWEEAISTWEQAIDAYEAAGDVGEAARICYEATNSLTWASRFGEAFAIGRRGIDLLGNEVSAVRARLLAQQALPLALTAPFETGDAVCSEALAIADEFDDEALRGTCLLYLAMNRYFWLYAQECADNGLLAAGLLHEAGNLWDESFGAAFAHVGLVGCGRFAEARQVEVRVEPLAERVGHVAALMICRRVKHMVGFAETGDLATFEAFGRADLELNLDNGLPWGCASHAWIGLALFLRGDWDTARHHFETGAEIEPPGGWNGHCRAHLLEFRGYAGERDAVLAMLDDADDNRMPVAGRINLWASWAVLFSAVEALYMVGEDGRAGDLHGLVVDCIEGTRAVCGSYHDVRLVQRVAGIAATAGRQWDAAEAHFRTALRQAADLPHLPEQAHTRRFFGDMLLRRDAPSDGAQAARLLAEAADLYRRMGMVRHVALTEDIAAGP